MLFDTLGVSAVVGTSRGPGGRICHGHGQRGLPPRGWTGAGQLPLLRIRLHQVPALFMLRIFTRFRICPVPHSLSPALSTPRSHAWAHRSPEVRHTGAATHGTQGGYPVYHTQRQTELGSGFGISRCRDIVSMAATSRTQAINGQFWAPGGGLGGGQTICPSRCLTPPQWSAGLAITISANGVAS